MKSLGISASTDLQISKLLYLSSEYQQSIPSSMRILLEIPYTSWII